MIKLVRRLLALLFLLAALPIPLAQAEGGVAVRPYWTFPTTAPVTHVETGDINGDGMPEIIMVTADNWLYVVENDGNLAWRYELETKVNDLLVADVDGDGQAAEIFIGGLSPQAALLSDTEKPVWISNDVTGGDPILAVFAADLDGDGRHELGWGSYNFMGILDSETSGGIFGNFFITEQPVIDIWTGDVNGDGRPEIVPNVFGGNQVSVLKDNLSLAWQQSIEGQVGLVQAGDVDGDGQAEVVVLSASWDLFLFESEGQQVWHKSTVSDGNEATSPVPGQMIVHDLDGDGRMEIIVLAPAAVQVFKGDGSQLWQHSFGLGLGRDAPGQTSEVLDATAPAARLTAADVNGDGQAEVIATSRGQGQVYLLDAQGQRLASYLAKNSIGSLAYADLNGDGPGEIIVGTETGLQVFGTAQSVEQREVWQSPFLGVVTALALADLDGDGRSETLAGSQEGQVYALADTGRILWKVSVRTAENLDFVLAVSSGDVDGDGQAEVVAYGSSKIYLLDSNGPRWVVPSEGKFMTGVAVHDLDGDGRAEIIVGGDSLLGNVNVVRLLDGAGKQLWEWELTEAVTAIGGDNQQILVGTNTGWVYRLSAAGAPVGAYELGARVLSFDAGLVITEEGQVYRLDEGGPTLVRALGVTPRLAQLSAGAAALITGEQEVRLIADDELPWQGTVNSRVLSLAAGDLNGDGKVEVAVGTDNGRVHLFGLKVNQPPLLTKPALAETRAGYTYSVDVNDPDRDVVTVTLEIWDPSTSLWLPQAVQTPTQGQGRLNFVVPDPFDTWDSGQESRFRFSYDDGYTQSTLSEIAGPFAIPTLPWYVYYGRWAGLAGLILLFPALAYVFYRRRQVYRRSPIGRAEGLLKQLRPHPDAAPLRLHTVALDEPALLAYLPGLAREAGEDAIADLSEGFQLILTRPELVVEGLRAVVRQGREDTGGEEAKEPRARLALQTESESHELENKRRTSLSLSPLANLYELCLEALEANTVARIVGLQASLANPKDSSIATNSVTLPATTEVVTTIKRAMAELGQAAQALYNYQRVETVEDKVAYLAQAIETLGRLDREFQATLPQPERNIFSRIAFNWLAVAANALEDLQGRAQIEVSLKTRQVLTFEQATLSLELRNTGRSPASNLTISLSPDQTFAVGNGTAQIDILPAGRSVLVEIPLSAALSVDQFRAEFAITFDDRERSGKTVAFADLVRLLKPVTEFQPVPNPYAPGTPLRPGAPTFFGRDDLFQFIAENMESLTRQNILVLIGQRRMGKTSFLQQLPARLSRDYLPVFLDGQSLGIDPGMANFFYDLSLAIADALADQGLEIEAPELAEFSERPSAAFERTFLPAVFKAIGQRRLLLLFDEFEELEMRVASDKLEPTIFPFFRHLMQHGDKLGFIFVGTHRLEELTADYWSILFNIALYKRVTFLGEVAARALIVEPVARYGLLYDDLALDKILRVTAGHPYFLQLICHALVNQANRTRQGYLTIQDVNDALGELVELGEAHFAFLWEQSSPPEQVTLAALMRLLNKLSTVTAPQIVELLTERGMTPDLREVREALRRLVERDIVHELAGEPPRYEYKVDLVRLWVEQYKPLGRVVEDVVI